MDETARSGPSGADRARYAIYFAPPADSSLWRFGCAVLGYDAYSGRDVPPIALPDVTGPELEEATVAPRRYGFHATLKAPFRLRGQASEADLLAACRHFGESRTAFSLSGLEVAALGPFLALVTCEQEPALHELAAEAVTAFEPFREPASEAETRRRREAGLSVRQDDHLRCYGYPYIFADFVFHMTLTGALDAELRTRLKAGLARRHRDVTEPVLVDAICLFRQGASTERFRLVRRFPFGAAAQEIVRPSGRKGR